MVSILSYIFPIAGAAALLLLFARSSRLAAAATFGVYADSYSVELLRLYAGGKQGLRYA
jgi:hypothetical protein